jgi:hypothetical protein
LYIVIFMFLDSRWTEWFPLLSFWKKKKKEEG